MSFWLYFSLNIYFPKLFGSLGLKHALQKYSCSLNSVRLEFSWLTKFVHINIHEFFCGLFTWL